VRRGGNIFCERGDEKTRHVPSGEKRNHKNNIFRNRVTGTEGGIVREHREGDEAVEAGFTLPRRRKRLMTVSLSNIEVRAQRKRRNEAKRDLGGPNECSCLNESGGVGERRSPHGREEDPIPSERETPANRDTGKAAGEIYYTDLPMGSGGRKET